MIHPAAATEFEEAVLDLAIAREAMKIELALVDAGLAAAKKILSGEGGWGPQIPQEWTPCAIHYRAGGTGENRGGGQ